MRTNLFSAVGLVLVLLCCSCQKDKTTQEETTKTDSTDPMSWQYKKGMHDPANESANIYIAEDDLLSFTHEMFIKNNNPNNLKWNEPNHNQYVYLCAKNLGISESRAKSMGEAAEMPDHTQSGIQNQFQQQWSHAYMYTSGGNWIWGDADDDFHDNFDGPEEEGADHEGFQNRWAGYYYAMNTQEMGDWYVGYGCHYITDVCLTLHSTFIFPKVSMALHHFDFEKWVENNWSVGHKFADVVENVDPSEYYTINNLRWALQKAAYKANYYKSEFSGKAWDAYGESGYPTEAGSGNEEAVKYTKQMIKEATKWTGGAIKYAMDKYDQWD